MSAATVPAGEVPARAVPAGVVLTRPSIDRLKDPAAAIKIPEIVLLLIAIICYCVDGQGYPAYALSVMLPSLLNSVVFLLVFLLGYDQFRRTPVELIIYVYTVLGMFISSIIMLTSEVPSTTASGVFCLFLVFVYCAEVWFAYSVLAYKPPEGDPNATTTTGPQQQQQPGVPVLSGGVLSSHTTITPPSSTPAPPYTVSPDAMDLGVGGNRPAGFSSTNPVYPDTMNYPPNPIPDTTSQTMQDIDIASPLPEKGPIP